MKKVLSLKNVSYLYPSSTENAVSNVSIDIEAGKIYSIAGINGSGKTTLGLIMRGFIPKIYHGTLSGEVMYNGVSMEQETLDSLAKEIGYVFQNPFTQMSAAKETVFEEVAFALENLGINPSEIRSRVAETIKLLGIEELENKNPMELSGGQKQKVAIASVVVMSPKILILDEPTSQLDPVATKEIFEIIKLLKAKGTTVILIEHKLELIAEYTDQLIIIKDGQIVNSGDVLSVLKSDKYTTSSLAYPKYYELYKTLNNPQIEPFYTLEGAIKVIGGTHE